MSDQSSDVKEMGDTHLYFDELLPWQKKAWEQVLRQFHDEKLPHGMLASGMTGTGKRAFVWRFVAYLLCSDKRDDGACGVCESCTWLKAGTHPDLMVLPASSKLGAALEPVAIKIDDIRELQHYSQTKGHGVKLIVLDNADTLTLGAANALLKTLEEPIFGVHLFLISDNASRLLPTIKSRVQTLPLGHIEQSEALDYIVRHTTDEEKHLAPMLLNLADLAPLQAIQILHSPWFGMRELWIKTFLALRNKSRLPIAASDYWQGVLSFGDFVHLTRLMLTDVVRVMLGLPSMHSDIMVAKLLSETRPLDMARLEHLLANLDDTLIATHQNVQEKIAYDKIMQDLADA